MNLDNYFDRIFIINLEHRKDRWQNILKVLRDNNIIKYERFPGIIPSIFFLNKSSIWGEGFSEFNARKVRKIRI